MAKQQLGPIRRRDPRSKQAAYLGGDGFVDENLRSIVERDGEAYLVHGHPALASRHEPIITRERDEHASRETVAVDARHSEEGEREQPVHDGIEHVLQSAPSSSLPDCTYMA